MTEDTASSGTMAHLSREANERLDGGGGDVATMIKEEKYILYVGTEEYVLGVQELLWGSERGLRDFARRYRHQPKGKQPRCTVPPEAKRQSERRNT